MKEKLVRVEFANPEIRSIDHISYISEAVEHASKNLMRKGVKIRILTDTSYKNSSVILNLLIPDEIAEPFSIGNHLRGVSDYLLKKYECYRQFRIGKRLFHYIENPSFSQHNELRCPITLDAALNAMSAFANLLHKTDDNSTEKVKKILAILDGNNPEE